MTFSFWQRPAGVPAYDVAVVGGGIVGCSAAFWVRRLRPAWRVAIVEAGALAQGASGRNAGLLLQGGTAADYATEVETLGAARARRLWQFTLESRDLIERELDGAAFAFDSCGSLVAAGTPDGAERLQASAGLLAQDGRSAAFLPADAVNERLGTTGLGAGLYVATGATVNPAALVRHIAARSGADVLEHHAVRGWEQKGQAQKLDTGRGHLEAGQLVLALGAYAPRLVPRLSAYVRPVRAQMLATAPAAARQMQHPVYSHEGYYYARQAAGGSVLVGGARHRHRAAEVGYADETTPALQADLEAYLYAHLPFARGLAVTHRWSGTMGFSPDGVPVVGAVPSMPGSVWATGFTGHGMSYGFRMGRHLAELLSGHEPEDHDLFQAERFASTAA